MPVLPKFAFAVPRRLPSPSSLQGRVVVLDIAFAATVGSSVSFDAITKPFIAGLGERLAAWVDHHDSDRHPEFAQDPRFHLSTKQEHGACPEMVTPALVVSTGAVDTIVTHVDLDGLYAAAKWVLGGLEPYPGADADARAVDTRLGVPGPIAMRIDSALRARFRDDGLKRAVIGWLVQGMGSGPDDDLIAAGAREFEARAAGTAALALHYEIQGRVAVVDAGLITAPFDKTDLLLAGQAIAPVSMVKDAGNATIAASFSSGWDFVAILALGGGMPTRVTVPIASWQDAVKRINLAPAPTPNGNSDETSVES